MAAGGQVFAVALADGSLVQVHVELAWMVCSTSRHHWFPGRRRARHWEHAARDACGMAFNWVPDRILYADGSCAPRGGGH